MSRRLGLIIGVNQYADPTFQPLQFAENDARALAQWLVNAKGGNWSPSDVQFVQGEHVTRELVESLITQMCLNMAEPGDLALIYFAGHTFLDEGSGEGYLALANTYYRRPTTGLHLLSFAQYVMTRSRASHILFIVDGFQTGPLWSSRRTSPYDVKPLLGPTLMNMLHQQGDRLFLCSCRGNELAAEAGERGLGLLMYCMIVGLSGPASDSATGTVTLQRLHPYLFGALGEQQRPSLFGQEHSPLVLVGNRLPVSEPQHVSPAGDSPFTTSNSPYMQRNTTEQLMVQAVQHQTATAQLSPQVRRTTSGQLLTSAVEQHRQQQCKPLLNQAQQLLHMQNYTEALNILEQVLQITPNDVSTLTLKGQLLGRMGRFQEALAVIEHLVQLDANNPLAWSMYAVVLTNIGQYQAALAAIERSLELDANNPETYSIKNNITAAMATAHIREGRQLERPSFAKSEQRGDPRSFFIGAAIQVVGLGMGTVGALLPIFQPHLPLIVAWVLESFGLALLCVNAVRGTYRHGFVLFLPTLLLSLLTGGLLGATYRLGYTRIIAAIQTHPSLLIPVVFLAAWLAVAAILPLVLALGGLLVHFAVSIQRRAG